MRKIDTVSFRRAGRRTAREINRTILFNLIRELQPVSRSELARRMGVARGQVTRIVDMLLDEGAVVEGEAAPTARGRRPIMLYVRTRDRFAVTVDIRVDQTTISLTDFECRQHAVRSLPTPPTPHLAVDAIAGEVQSLLQANEASVEGVAVVLPGMVQVANGRVLNSPQLGWRNFPFGELLAEKTGLNVVLENAPVACALGQIWLMPSDTNNFAYVTVSDGVGVGLVVNGDVVRGAGGSAGEFGHLPFDLNGPLCRCGLRGCLEAYVSNHATVARYLGSAAPKGLTIKDVIRRAESGDVVARVALLETARYLGAGFASIITVFNPDRIMLSGEIAAAWPLIKDTVETTAYERALTDGGSKTAITIAPPPGIARFRGAAALLFAPRFAMPKIA